MGGGAAKNSGRQVPLDSNASGCSGRPSSRDQEEESSAKLWRGPKPSTVIAPEEIAQDRELVERTLGGDLVAYEELFRQYRQRIFGLGYRLLKDEDAALEIVQEAFIRAYESLAQYRGDSGFYPWIRRIATNLAIDYLRASRHLAEVSFDETLYGEGHDEAVPSHQEKCSPVKSAELSEFSQAIWTALDQLSENHRTVFVLYAVEGLMYREIAQVMNCSIGTVMSRLHYARRKLQALLEPYLE